MISAMQRIQAFLKADYPVRWLFNGDSITHGIYHTYGCRDYTEMFSEHVRGDLARIHDLVIKSAYSGDTTIQLLDTFEHRVEAVRPHVVFYMIGMNDVHHPARAMPVEQFRQNLDLLGQKTEKMGALAVLQTCNGIWGDPQSDYKNEQLELFMNVVRELAHERNWPLVDHHACWNAHSGAWPLWLNDPIHPNHFGHRVFFHHLIETLGAKAAHVTEQQRFHVPQWP